MNRYPPRALLLSWAALMALLGLTVLGAYQPLGAFNTGLALAIALGKALIVGVIFMELRERNGLTIAFAGAGFFWLAIMLWLALGDFVTRPYVPPRAINGMLEMPARRALYRVGSNLPGRTLPAKPRLMMGARPSAGTLAS